LKVVSNILFFVVRCLPLLSCQIAFLRLHKRPPRFDDTLSSYALSSLPYAVLGHCIIGAWMFSGPELVGYSTATQDGLISADSHRAPGDLFNIGAMMGSFTSAPMVVLFIVVVVLLIMRGTVCQILCGCFFNTQRDGCCADGCCAALGGCCCETKVTGATLTYSQARSKILLESYQVCRQAEYREAYLITPSGKQLPLPHDLNRHRHQTPAPAPAPGSAGGAAAAGTASGTGPVGTGTGLTGIGSVKGTVATTPPQPVDYGGGGGEGDGILRPPEFITPGVLPAGPSATAGPGTASLTASGSAATATASATAAPFGMSSGTSSAKSSGDAAPGAGAAAATATVTAAPGSVAITVGSSIGDPALASSSGGIEPMSPAPAFETEPDAANALSIPCGSCGRFFPIVDNGKVQLHTCPFCKHRFEV
jgi:hypothetical protein